MVLLLINKGDNAQLETIYASLISAAVTLAVCLITNHAQAEKTMSLIEYRLNELTEQVSKHNSVIERVYNLETEAKRHDDELHRVNRRLEVIEDDQK